MAIVFTEEQAGNYLRQQSGYKSSIDDIQKQYQTGVSQLNSQFQNGLIDLNKSYGIENYNLGRDFTQSMRQAFDAAQQQRSSFLSQSGTIGSGQRQAMAIDLEQATINAYDSYIQNYMKNKQNLEQNLKSAVASIESNKAKGLQTLFENAQNAQAAVEKDVSIDAANYAAFANAPMEYLKKLWETNPDVFNDGVLNRYTYVDENGNRQLISSDELNSSFFEITDNGMELTDSGKEFYQLMAYGLGNIGSLDKYLQENNKDLYDWAIKSNVYGDTETVNQQGYSTNFDAVMSSLIGSDAVSTGSFDSTMEPKYRSKYAGENVSVYENSKDFGTVKQVKSAKGVTISSPEGLQYSALLNWDDVKEYKDDKAKKSENFKATYTDDSGVTKVYNLKVLKDEAESDVFADISNAFGKIEERRIYDYGGETYIGVIDDNGKSHLRKVKIDKDLKLQKMAN